MKAYEALAVHGTKVVEIQDSRVAELEAKVDKLTEAIKLIYEDPGIVERLKHP
jgi:hypothetical protein